MNLYDQISTHSTRSFCFLLLIFEISSIISNVSSVSRSSSQYQPLEQIIVGRPYKKTTDNNRSQHRQNHLSNKSQDEVPKEEDQLKYPSPTTLNVNEAVSSSSFLDSSSITQPAIGDHSLADDSLLDGDNKSDTELFDTLDEPKIEGE